MKTSNKHTLGLALLLALLGTTGVSAQIELRTEAQATVATGDHAPLWLNANKYGLSSIDKTNGYVRAAALRPLETDSARRWGWSFCADVAVATGFTSTLVVQQAYGELRWLKGLLTVGSKQQPMELKNQELSSGSQTLGINARPLPSVRLSIPHYWDIPGTRGWLAVKGHVAYGMQTDDRWQRSFTDEKSLHTEHTLLHTKAGYLRIGREDRIVTAELGLEMACQFGGTSHAFIEEAGNAMLKVENEGGLKGAWHAFIPGGYEKNEQDISQKNAEGNHLGSIVARVNADFDAWGVSVYADHFFEDHSQMFFFAKDGYGEGAQWQETVNKKYFVYDLRDIMLGAELRLKNCRWVDAVVAEYLYTKYQSGPIYHDHTMNIADQISGNDNYYNHHMFTGWQHWGQVIGNPLYLSPVYNDDGHIAVKDNRFWAWHLAASGNPLRGLHYRLMCTWQKGFGTYNVPYEKPRRNTSLLAEVSYTPSGQSRLAGWSLKGALAMDRGELLGDNFGVQLTLARRFSITK